MRTCIRILGIAFLALGLYEVIFPPYFWWVELGAAVVAGYGALLIWATRPTPPRGGSAPPPDSSSKGAPENPGEDIQNRRNP
jgi:hypothetical protein